VHCRHEESALKTSPLIWDVCARIAARHPDVPAGRVLAIVVRTVADLHKVSGRVDRARGADLEQVVEELAERVLFREGARTIAG
jgi:hypothetical protein